MIFSFISNWQWHSEARQKLFAKTMQLVFYESTTFSMILMIYLVLNGFYKVKIIENYMNFCQNKLLRTMRDTSRNTSNKIQIYAKYCACIVNICNDTTMGQNYRI